jgi:hypothetical protein
MANKPKPIPLPHCSKCYSDIVPPDVPYNRVQNRYGYKYHLSCLPPEPCELCHLKTNEFRPDVTPGRAIAHHMNCQEALIAAVIELQERLDNLHVRVDYVDNDRGGGYDY